MALGWRIDCAIFILDHLYFLPLSELIFLLKIKAIKVLLQARIPKVDALGKAAPASLILVLMDNLLIL